MTNKHTDFTFTVNCEASASIHENGIVILHVGSGRVYTANTTGARIWRGVVQRQRLDAIADDINNEYQIGRSTACEHVATFLAELERHSLVQKEENR
ncbi:MAG TPA: PqqD family protein [Candidatus Sulfotelmatobacter sp.]|jgi:Tfp pilus assembly protein FimT|nr:PqqD family protein [Candidatus Sulfotelmatobacter sp.]